MVYQQVAPSLRAVLIEDKRKLSVSVNPLLSTLTPRTNAVPRGIEDPTVSKPKVKKLSTPARLAAQKARRLAPKPKRVRIEYKVKKVKGGYKCACGCGAPVAKLFAKGHVSKFVKLLQTKSLAYCVARLKELKERIR